MIRPDAKGGISRVGRIKIVTGRRLAGLRPTEKASTMLSPQLVAGYFQVTSIPKKCMNTSRFGLFFGFCCGLRM